MKERLLKELMPKVQEFYTKPACSTYPQKTILSDSTPKRPLRKPKPQNKIYQEKENKLNKTIKIKCYNENESIKHVLCEKLRDLLNENHLPFPKKKTRKKKKLTKMEKEQKEKTENFHSQTNLNNLRKQLEISQTKVKFEQEYLQKAIENYQI
eukprot:snap_masked-scaffold_15-processed-gene-7.22-mRNA-1 protein AED:1.00 eAED:1.00 QI:0/-1/0/0/-1/1/1/0/152